jgi:hypothetical protein
MKLRARLITLLAGAAALLALLAERALAVLSPARTSPSPREGSDARAATSRGDAPNRAFRHLASLDEGRGAKGLPRAFAASGSFYAASSASIRRFSTEGRLLAELSLPAPVEALLASGSMLYAAAGGAVYALAEDGFVPGASEPRALFDLGPGARIVSLARDASTGDLYAACAARALVYRCSADGRLLALIGAPGGPGGSPGLVAPSPYLGVSVAPDGMVIVANPGRHGVELYEPGGRLVASFYKGPGSPDGFCNPVGVIAMGESVVTIEKGTGRLRRYARDGALLEELKGADAELSLFAALASSYKGSLYLLDPEDWSVLILEGGA